MAATEIWRGMGEMLDDQRVLEEVEELVGVMDGYDRTVITQYLGGLELAETPLTFEQLPFILAMAYGGSHVGVADGAGTGFVYTTTIPTTAAPTAKSWTVETGDDAEQEEMEYAQCTEFTLSGVAGETAKMSATLMGRQVTQSTITPSLAVPTAEDCIASKGKVYIDAIGGSFGGTQVASQILAFELTCEAMWVPKMTLDGNLYFTLTVFAGQKISGKLTFEHDTAVLRASGAKLDFMNQTAKKLRLDLIGSALTTPATYSTKKVLIDLPIKYTKAGVISDKDGNDIVDMEFRSRYNGTAGTAGSIIVVNQRTTLI